MENSEYENYSQSNGNNYKNEDSNKECNIDQEYDNYNYSHDNSTNIKDVF